MPKRSNTVERNLYHTFRDALSKMKEESFQKVVEKASTIHSQENLGNWFKQLCGLRDFIFLFCDGDEIDTFAQVLRAERERISLLLSPKLSMV